jgi:3-oxoacyl-[acyl-carrier-protein] synthase-3
MQKAWIKAISFNVPKKRVSNDELAKTIDTSDEWITSHTGIKFRHIADEKTAASDLALQPCLDVIEQAHIDPKEIDLIIVATITQDYIGFPSTACVLQDKLGAVNAGAMDLAAACTGYIYSLETAKALIKTGSAKNILVVSSEILTKITDWTDRNTCVLFGDGAGASLVSLNEENDVSDIIYSVLGSEGDGALYLMRRGGGSRHPIPTDRIIEENPYIIMDGQKVYHFAVRVFCSVIKQILEKYNLSINDIAYIVPHQANIRIIEAASKRLKIPIEKFYVNIQEYANTSGATIPIAMGEMVQKGLLHRGDYIITVGFGGGLTYGGNLIRW